MKVILLEIYCDSVDTLATHIVVCTSTIPIYGMLTKYITLLLEKVSLTYTILPFPTLLCSVACEINRKFIHSIYYKLSAIWPGLHRIWQCLSVKSKTMCFVWCMRNFLVIACERQIQFCWFSNFVLGFLLRKFQKLNLWRNFRKKEINEQIIVWWRRDLGANRILNLAEIIFSISRYRSCGSP